MADSNKEVGRDEDDHHRPFDYTDSKKEEETTGHAGDGEEGHDDDDYTDSKKEEGHDDRPFDYSFIVLARVADAFLRNGYPEGYACAGEERSPPLQRPQDCSHGRVATKKPRSCFFQEKLSINKKRRVSSPASSASHSDDDKLVKPSSSRGKTKLQESASTSKSSTNSEDDPRLNTQLLRRWGVSKSRSRRIYSNSGEGTSTHLRLQRDHPAAGADPAAGRHQPPPAPAAPQAGSTWTEVHREMGGGEVVRIGKKTVHRSDTCKHQSRLLLNQGLEAQVYKHVLQRERNMINSLVGLEVEVLNYYGERFRMTCRYRASQKGMVFNSGWSKFLKQRDGSHVKEGESLLLLAFRTQQQRLCFVFVPQHLEDKINLQHQHD